MSFIKTVLDLNVRASRAFDRMLPSDMSVDGSRYFRDKFVRPIVRPGAAVCDVGSGRFPFFDVAEKKALGITVIGLDLHSSELEAAPPESYDQKIITDITCYSGSADADVVISHAVLEHVRDTRAALRAISTITRHGGSIALFVPSRNAAFARLNLILPDKIKQHLLKYLQPNQVAGGGWPAFYDMCTPKDFRLVAATLGLKVVEIRPFFMSTYFSVFFPLWVVWRLWLLCFRLLSGENSAETFCIHLLKP
jgi:2-polyprenyl-6-hydroxyphenyl methylase/3-demethylubiquinone-9 3-methyltransferase